MRRRGWWLLGLLTGVAGVVAACGGVLGARGVSLPPGEDPSIANGRSIYYTGYTLRGEPVRYEGGPFAPGMMGGNLACAACHGPDGRGGTHWMHMQVMDAPDIRPAALAGEGHDEGPGKDDHDQGPAEDMDAAHDEGGDNEHAEGAYDLETFRLAVVEGRHPNGESLDPLMPRWRLSDQDLADLWAFLQTLP